MPQEKSTFDIMRASTLPGALDAPVTPKKTLAQKLASLGTLNNGLQIVGAVGGLWGNYLINSSSAAGFLFWLVSNAALVWLQCRTRLWALVALHLAYIYLCLQGMARWSARSPDALPSWVPDSLLKFISIFS